MQWSYRPLLFSGLRRDDSVPLCSNCLRASRAPSSMAGTWSEAHQVLGIGPSQLAPYLICQLCQELLPGVVLNLGQAPQQVCQVASGEVAPLCICTDMHYTVLVEKLLS